MRKERNILAKKGKRKQFKTWVWGGPLSSQQEHTCYWFPVKNSSDAIKRGYKKKRRIPTEFKVIRSSSSGAAQEVRSLPWRTGECGCEELSLMEPFNQPPPSPKLRGSVGAGDTRWTRPLLVRLDLLLWRASCAAQPSYTDGKHNQTRVPNHPGHSKFYKLS